MNMRFYTNEQVHQIVDQLLLQFDEAAPGPEPAHLNNDIPQQSSPENKVTLTVSEAAELIGKYEIVPAAVAKKAIPACNITFLAGGEMRQALSGYLNVLFEQNPKAVGGALPADDFYYNAK